VTEGRAGCGRETGEFSGPRTATADYNRNRSPGSATRPLPRSRHFGFGQESQQEEVHIQVRLAGQIRGFVRTVDGQPIPDAFVRAVDARPGLYSSHDASTDESGAFDISALPPAPYRLRVFVDDCAEAFRNLACPSPMDLALQFGESRDVVLIVGGGSSQVVGRVVTPVGNAFPHPRVLAFYPLTDRRDDVLHGTYAEHAKSVVGDAQGRFVIDGLTAGNYAVQVEPFGYRPRRDPSENRTAKKPETKAVTLRDGDSVDLGTITAWESHPYRVVGRVVASPDWKAKSPLGTGAIDLRVTASEAELPHVVHFRQTKIKLHKTGVEGVYTFEWYCETPHREVEFQVVHRLWNHQTYLLAAERIAPVPDATHHMSLNF
jgi:hypothetical protein